MRSLLRTVIMATAALVAAVAVFVGLSLPPRATALDPPLAPTQVIGAYHIHTTRSDGTGTVEQVAAAAARAGLKFVIITDHGDATRQPDPPTYRDGVLCIDAIEISTRQGHVVALGLGQASPYPLAGDARDVIEDIHRMRGVAIVAHPDSPSPGLRWTSPVQTFDGIEWLNLDSEWRSHSTMQLVAAAARALIRPPEAIAALADRPVRTLRRWDGAVRQRPLFGLAALDAHARIGSRDDERAASWTTLAQPSYETMFRTVAQIVEVPTPLQGDAAADAASVLHAITIGRSYSIVRALAGPASLSFTAANDAGQRWDVGERVPSAAAAAGVTLRAVTTAAGAALTIYANGQPIARGVGSVTVPAAGPGSYRAEATWDGADVPWLMSNPIVLESDRPTRAPAPEPPPAADGERRLLLPSSDTWAVEREASSEGAMSIDGERLTLDYRLGPGAPRGQYAALSARISESAGVDRIAFVGQASAPMRVSVQVRLPGGRDGQRWQRSVYLDTTPRPVVIRLQDLEPVDVPTSGRPIVAPLQSLLFVVDTVNARPGTAGRVTIWQVGLGLNRLAPQ